MDKEIFVSKVDHIFPYAENSRFSKPNLRSVSRKSSEKLITVCNSTILVSKKVFHLNERSCNFDEKKSKVWPDARSSLVQYQTKMGQKIIFFYFCYLFRVEHKKFSEMSVWIVRFSLKLRKWDYF
jgi:hypothetical protein